VEIVLRAACGNAAPLRLLQMHGVVEALRREQLSHAARPSPIRDRRRPGGLSRKTQPHRLNHGQQRGEPRFSPRRQLAIQALAPNAGGFGHLGKATSGLRNERKAGSSPGYRPVRNDKE
jgi:hypothetical protein